MFETMTNKKYLNIIRHSQNKYYKFYYLKFQNFKYKKMSNFQCKYCSWTLLETKVSSMYVIFSKTAVNWWCS